MTIRELVTSIVEGVYGSLWLTPFAKDDACHTRFQFSGPKVRAGVLLKRRVDFVSGLVIITPTAPLGSMAERCSLLCYHEEIRPWAERTMAAPLGIVWALVMLGPSKVTGFA